MKKQMNSIDQLNIMITQDKAFNEKVFHKAKLLLKLYKDVVWRLEETICDMDAQAYDFGGRRIAQLMEFLSFEFEGDMDKRLVEKQLMNIEETHMLIDIVDKALMKLKKYPEYGELYFEIITKQYIYKNRYTEREMLEIINVERTMFYKRKKEAINLMGVILWGYILPPLQEYWAQVDFSGNF